ncbi:glutaminyl-tRNA synthase (glutamine-hydrolyzing) subunit A [Candidatus Daviesbacteria bacterium RIFCSPHIGHO2_02_FULL_39_12]|uniref:Glutamyl-tRNA(Gln) amidotransferase subunit A n=2 Tax=Candidatus Daviesiibacteriota TaxID=1752718 RepID=A0A1F5JDN7_9BACT|nr:MAG: glutaminyl-tRNA synthase (glutamine-hydrolyzing) subunit A [Candidatus Daviesbacteria bacterium RIFCSPHIGHO2_02_FULL_39_12]OGE71535.1 MAG: glutaminyl-tRNA synthase (glutamine-hydrolyzing) subunit A [Candidatus Daviesbacteria bacterium RIFCSPLOWO2_02_FULL_38_15]
MDLHKLTIKQAKDALKKKEVTAEQLTKACLNRIQALEPKLNAFVTTLGEEAISEAKKADQKIAEGVDLPLLGIPVAIKDNFCTQDIRTTASSKVLDNFIPPYDATVVVRLKEAGVVILGKTNMDAWAHGSSTETSDYGLTKNPWDINYLPGGSSGGSAASIAADETIGAIGSETAGSIRQPAAWCGVVGLKPTYGRVSRYGVIAMGSSLDCPGPIAKTVEDSAIMLQVLAGKDLFDATTSPKTVEDYTKSLSNNIEGLTIGVSDDYFTGVEDEVKQKVEDVLKEFEKLGVKIKKIKLFDPKYAIAVYTILQRAEVSSNLARYDGIRFGNDRSYFGEEAKRRIMLGTYVLSAGYYDQYYSKAQKVRTVIVEDFNRAFKEVDVIVGPTSPSVALPLGSSKNHPMFGEMADVLVEPSTIAGLPGISIPCGFTKNGLPVGLQVIGPQFSESLILNVAYKYEQATNWHKEKPEL